MVAWFKGQHATNSRLKLRSALGAKLTALGLRAAAGADRRGQFHFIAAFRAEFGPVGFGITFGALGGGWLDHRAATLWTELRPWSSQGAVFGAARGHLRGALGIFGGLAGFLHDIAQPKSACNPFDGGAGLRPAGFGDFIAAWAVFLAKTTHTVEV